jgi:hypothetical protein
MAISKTAPNAPCLYSPYLSSSQPTRLPRPHLSPYQPASVAKRYHWSNGHGDSSAAVELGRLVIKLRVKVVTLRKNPILCFGGFKVACGKTSWSRPAFPEAFSMPCAPQAGQDCFKARIISNHSSKLAQLLIRLTGRILLAQLPPEAGVSSLHYDITVSILRG